MSPGLRSWTGRGALLVLPVILAVTGLWLARSRGPLWLAGNSDPSYIYLLNSLLVLSGQPPCHVDHPGTTVQTLGAVTLALTTAGADHEQQTRAVLADPERALAHLHLFFLLTGALALAAAGLLVKEQTGSMIAALALQLTPLLQVETYRATLYVAPEALLSTLTVLLAALLLARESDPPPGTGRRAEILSAIFLGLVAAAGLVTKVTFAPLCALPFLLARTWRSVLWTAGAFVVGAALYLAPIYPELPRMLRWFTQLATHQGLYGSGPAGFADVAAYPSTIMHLLWAERVLAGAALGGLLVAGATLGRRLPGPRVRRRVRLLLGVTAVQALAVLLVAKHPHPHYLLPAAVSASLNVVLAWQLLAEWPPTWHRRAGLAAAAAALVVAGAAAPVELTRYSHALAGARDDQVRETRRADDLTRGGIRVDYYRSSSLPFALSLGNTFAWRLYAEPLAQLHPGSLFFNVARGRFEDFSGPVPPAAVGRRGRIFLVGNGALEDLPAGKPAPTPPGWHLTLLDCTGGTTVHELRPGD